jgi:hypothetical protein
VLDQRGQLLRAALGFAGLVRLGLDVACAEPDRTSQVTWWVAMFYTTGMEHSPTSATGTAWERTPWHATQRAASMPASTGEEVAPSAPGPAFLAGFAYAIGATPRGSSKSPLGSDAR